MKSPQEIAHQIYFQPLHFKPADEVVVWVASLIEERDKEHAAALAASHAEVERLREALTRIAAEEITPGDESQMDYERLVLVARAALAGDKKEPKS